MNGKGDIIKSGGTVVKNVTGYDLSKLVTGSFGTLVALTEITLKVLPKKKLSNTITIYTDDKKLVKNLFEKISGSSSEVSGAVYIPEEPKDENYDQGPWAMEPDYRLYHSGARAGYLDIYYLGFHRYSFVSPDNDFISLVGEDCH